MLAALGVSDPLLDIAKELEQVALADDYFIERKLYPNVDFYTGVIYKAMGFPTAHVHGAVRDRPPARLDRPLARDERRPGHQDRPPAAALHRRARARLARRPLGPLVASRGRFARCFRSADSAAGRVDVGTSETPDPIPRRPPVEEIAEEGVLIAAAAVRLAVTNRQIVRARCATAPTIDETAAARLRSRRELLVARAREASEDAERTRRDAPSAPGPVRPARCTRPTTARATPTARAPRAGVRRAWPSRLGELALTIDDYVRRASSPRATEAALGRARVVSVEAQRAATVTRRDRRGFEHATRAAGLVKVGSARCSRCSERARRV